MSAILLSFGAAFVFLLTAELPIRIAIFVVWGIAAWLLPKPKTTLAVLLVTAALLRFLFLLEPPLLSSDLFRYLWEGQLLIEGGNPYLEPPASFEREDEILAQVNHPEVPSVYPPIALWCFAVASQLLYAPLSIKIMMCSADLWVLYLIGRLLGPHQQAFAWIYALHPLPIIETAGSGHLEPLAIAPFLLALLKWRQHKTGAFWIVVASGVKLLPLVLLPHFRKDWIGFTLGAFLLLFISLPLLKLNMSQGLLIYVEHWSFNGSVYPLLEWCFPQYGRSIVLIIGVVLTLWVLWFFEDPVDKSLWITGAFVLLSPTVHPWYGLWVFPFALLCGAETWIFLLSLLPLSYVALLSYDPQTHSWDPPIWPQWIEYLLPLCALLIRQSRRSVHGHLEED